MQLPVFENAFLLKSLGWAIANSLWQTGVLWMLYQVITWTDRKLPALVKHHLSISLLLSSFVWFITTFIGNYRMLSAGGFPPMVLNEGLVVSFQHIDAALPVISIVYLLLLCCYAGRFTRHLFANRLLQSTGLTKAPIDLRLFATKTALHLGIKKKIQVWLSENVDVPSVTGFIKPVILLPAAFINHLSVPQIEAILLHELAHIRRNDYIVNLLQSIVELVLFFNPFACMLSKAAKKERENCCDEWVMNFQYDRYEYATALLILEEQRHLRQFRFALAATNGKKILLERVKRLFDAHPHTEFSSFERVKLMGFSLLILVGALTLLPFFSNKKPGSATRLQSPVTVAKLPVYFVKEKKEISSYNTIANRPVKPTRDKTAISATNNQPKKRPVNQSSSVYVNAFINEDLLISTNQPEPLVTPVVEKETKNLKFLVKIEEQQSGKKQTNTYYYELNNKDGNPAVKPLLMLNRITEPIKKTAPGNLPDSLDTSTKPNNKKKITS